MTDFRKQLRSFIAPGAPATRTTCDGTEPDLRVEYGFTPRWYRAACGIDFSERWHLDPVYRYECNMKMRRELNRRFPELSLGGSCPDDAPATIDGVQGALTIAMIFGVPARYYVDNWPAAEHYFLDADAVARLRVPDLSSNPVMMQLMEQMDWIAKEFGRIRGYINWQGVLNNAYRLRGPDIFTDLAADPELARHLFQVVSETMVQGIRLVYERQRESGVTVRFTTVSNCMVNMVSAECYREQLFPWDEWIAGQFDVIGVHNCAWNADPYVADYARLKNLGYVDMGIESDFARARELCPNARRAVMYTPMDLATKSLVQIEADVERIRRDYAPCDIVMADIDDGIRDERVLAFAKLAAE